MGEYVEFRVSVHTVFGFALCVLCLCTVVNPLLEWWSKEGVCLSYVAAVSYSPTLCRVQYHWRLWA